MKQKETYLVPNLQLLLADLDLPPTREPVVADCLEERLNKLPERETRACSDRLLQLSRPKIRLHLAHSDSRRKQINHRPGVSSDSLNSTLLNNSLNRETLSLGILPNPRSPLLDCSDKRRNNNNNNPQRRYLDNHLSRNPPLQSLDNLSKLNNNLCRLYLVNNPPAAYFGGVQRNHQRDQISSAKAHNQHSANPQPRNPNNRKTSSAVPPVVAFLPLQRMPRK
jgi:hypothetical protein